MKKLQIQSALIMIHYSTRILLASIVTFLLVSCGTSPVPTIPLTGASPTANPADPQPEPTSTPENSSSEQTRSQDNAVMMEIPGGTFMMGSEAGNDDEKPVHEVSLDAFLMDQTEVTNSMFADFLNVNGNQEEEGGPWFDAEDSDAQIHLVGETWQADDGKSDHPVVEVSWFGAQAYCTWVGARLPTEAEWEYAARGGLDGKDYPWGDEKPVCETGADNGAQFFSCSNLGSMPVRSFLANGYGLYDMAGNVMEWVGNWPEPYPGGESAARSFPEQFRVLRGGSWSEPTNNLRVAFRYDNVPSLADHFVGFRCAK